eukprot:TRINITY_DN19650_c0_g1_i1.p1 TRINITY_DN19650_c0_g1~~TRINITY_DN19650_c0_g1_i1.p1  ORF type:complete len:459 (+),score=30.93 TRINITY_DN19650_c0_g1_i1:61-1377(+)
MAKSVHFAICCLFVVHAAVLALFLLRCPDAYMDETLHIPQAQKYCAGDFWHWDPKITTLPGTYLISAFSLFPRKWLSNEETCSTTALRSVNALALGPLVVLLTAKVLEDIHGDGSATTSRAIAMRLLRIAFMPLHFFFCFLYYTDISSTGAILCMYWLHRRQWLCRSAVVGGAAVMVRQTNIVWVWGLAVHAFGGSGGVGAWASRLVSRLTNGSLLPHAVVGVSFVAFVVLNGGIVVGDRSHHAAVLHLAMVPYLAVFVLFFLGPSAWIEMLGRLRRAHPRAIVEGFAVALIFAAMTFYGSFAHPFLLADNRHVTFYLWKNLLRKLWVRCGLLPLALGVAMTAFRTPGARPFIMCNRWEIALWGLCCILVVIPTPLLEFRYFLVPTLLMLLHQRLGSAREEALGVFVSVAINMVTIGIFLYRPFWSSAWGDAPQRFMW